MTRTCALETNKFEKKAGRFFQVVRHFRRVRHNPFNPAVSRPANGVKFFSHEGLNSLGVTVV